MEMITPPDFDYPRRIHRELHSTGSPHPDPEAPFPIVEYAAVTSGPHKTVRMARKYKSWLVGPPGTPYDGGTWELDIHLPANYPLRPPIVTFVTPIWHPFVCPATGAVKLAALHESWVPQISLQMVLLILQTMLINLTISGVSGVFNDEQTESLVDVWATEGFNQTARHWRDAFAMSHAVSAVVAGQPVQGASATSQLQHTPRQSRSNAVTRCQPVQQLVQGSVRCCGAIVRRALRGTHRLLWAHARSSVQTRC